MTQLKRIYNKITIYVRLWDRRCIAERFDEQRKPLQRHMFSLVPSTFHLILRPTKLNVLHLFDFFIFLKKKRRKKNVLCNWILNESWILNAARTFYEKKSEPVHVSLFPRLSYAVHILLSNFLSFFNMLLYNCIQHINI